jgi:hypothetical protein
MASKNRPGSAKRTVAKQEAARKRGAPGKQFVGETAAQSARAKQAQRKKVARMARAARSARPAEAARTAGPAPAAPKSRKAKAPPRPRGAPAPAPGLDTRKLAEAEAELRASEERAALAGAEVEPAEGPLASVSRLPTPEERDPVRLADAEAARRAVAPEVWTPPSDDVSREHGAAEAAGGSPPLGWAMTDLVRSALGLLRTVVAVPFRIAVAVPRFALRAVFS